MLRVKERTEERLAHGTSQSAPPSLLRAPFRPFWHWWAFWALFPLMAFVPEWLFTGLAGWVVIPMWMALFFWSALNPMRVWLQSPRPVWLFLVLWMLVPFALAAAVPVLLRLVGLYHDP